MKILDLIAGVMGCAFIALVVFAVFFWEPKRHHVTDIQNPNDPTRARIVSYTDDGTVVYWADVPPGTAEIQITIQGARTIASVHVVQAMTLGGLYCHSQDDGTCK